MSNPALSVIPTAPPSAPTVTPEQHELIRTTIGKGLTNDQLKLFCYECLRHGIHPLDGLLYPVIRGGRFTIITAIDLMRMRAAETGEYVGNDAYEFSGTPGKPGFMATARVWRRVQGERVPFTRTAHWEEFVPPTGQDHMYRRMPHVMLGKVAEAQALRAGFPRQLHGLYAAEELQAEPVEKSQARPVENSDVPPVEKSDVLTPAQRKTVIDTARAHGWTDDQLKAHFAECGWTSTKEIPAAVYDELIAALERGRTIDEMEEGG